MRKLKCNWWDTTVVKPSLGVSTFQERSERVLVYSLDNYIVEVASYYGNGLWISDCDEELEQVVWWMDMPDSPDDDEPDVKDVEMAA